MTGLWLTLLLLTLLAALGCAHHNHPVTRRRRVDSAGTPPTLE